MVIDWLQPWPRDALYEVARNFLQLIEELGEEDSKQCEAVVEFFPYSFEFVGQKSIEYLQVQKRFSYSTPKSFLELIKSDIAMLKINFASTITNRSGWQTAWRNCA